MKRILCLLLCVAPFVIFAQEYSFMFIPDSLRKANAVKRFEELHVIIKSPSKAVVRHKWVITILNEGGERFNGYVNSYDKTQPLIDITGKLYDAFGKQLRTVKKKDIEDRAAYDGISLVSDNRIKEHNFYYKSYPYTVEYEDEQEYDGLFFLPAWTPVDGEHFSVQHSRFVVEAPDGYKFRYRQNNLPANPQVSGNVHTWELKNQKAIKYEPFQPAWSEVLPSVYIAPTEFEVGGYKGDMTTWQSLGKFISTLNAGRDQLPEDLKQQVQDLVKNAATVEEKVKLLYEFLQKKTRYISIQLGIGGWQPFEASYVNSKSYGDCKALSNYMVSLLKVAGIKANYVLIKAGDGEKGLWEDFPSPYFNHAIMCVPNGKDTLWLECTSQTQSPGYMGSFTGNRKVLMITDDGGVVVKTPAYLIDDNLQIRKTTAIVDAEGNLSAEVNTRFTGEQQDDLHHIVHGYTSHEKEKYLNTAINLPTYKVDKFEYKEHKGRVPAIDEYIKLSAPLYASVSGRRLFIQPNLFSKTSTKLTNENERKQPLELKTPFRDVDTISISVPKGYEPEAVPRNMSITSKFGKYSISFDVSGERIDVLRSFERVSGVFPPSDFAEFVKFYDDIYKADRSKLVLVKKE